MAIFDNVKLGGHFNFIILFISVIFAFCVISCNGKANYDCPPYRGTFYVADSINKCIYYVCNSGHLLGNYKCPSGSGVHRWHYSRAPPCRVKQIYSCSRFGGGMDVSTPVPSKPTTAAEETTVEMTTVVDDVTTMGDDITTEEAGSGDDDGLMPVGPPPSSGGSGSLFEFEVGKIINGGIKLPSASFEGCLAICKAIGPPCVAIDYHSTEKSCYFHQTATACGTLEDKTGNIHLSFVTC